MVQRRKGRYLYTATFGAKTWYYNRYCHVYLLKLFTFLSGGDPLIGVRVWWSFVLAATVASLAVAVRAVGRGLQIRTLGVTLFVLFSQPVLFGLIGAGFADYSAMMFVTAAAALALHDIGRGDEQPAPGRRWIAFVLGVLTVAATRSKEVGAILALLPLLYLVAPGPGLDLRRFARKIGWWLAGVATAQLAIMAIDAWLLGDFFFTINWNRLLKSNHLNFPSGVSLRGADWSRHLLEPSIRNLLLAVSAAAIWAGAARRRLERRLLHLLPISYVLALIALYVRLPHPFSTRMLIPILPVACLMAGLLLHDAGLDDVPWRTFFTPGVLLPGGIAAAGVLLLLVPYQSGDLDAASILPVDWLLRFGWTPGAFRHRRSGSGRPPGRGRRGGARGRAAGRACGRDTPRLLRPVRPGSGFYAGQPGAASRRAARRPLALPMARVPRRAGGEGPISVVLSRDLFDRYRMSAHTRASLAQARAAPAGRQSALQPGICRGRRISRSPVPPPTARGATSCRRWKPPRSETATVSSSSFAHALLSPASASPLRRRELATPRGDRWRFGLSSCAQRRTWLPRPRRCPGTPSAGGGPLGQAVEQPGLTDARGEGQRGARENHVEPRPRPARSAASG